MALPPTRTTTKSKMKCKRAKRRRGQGTRKDKEENILHLVISFSELCRASSDANRSKHHPIANVVGTTRSNDKDDIDGDGGQETEDELYIIVQKILISMESGAETEDGVQSTSMMPNVDIASLLLPWLTGRLLQNRPLNDSQKNLLWGALFSTMEAFVASGSSAQATRNTLTQKTLNKLVSLSMEPFVQGSEFELAAKCYVVMMDHFYRPNLESICSGVLRIIYERFDEFVETHDVIASTLRLMTRAQSQANPKSQFQLLSKASVFLPLSRIYEYFHCHQANNPESELVREILANGLFSKECHLDGFRTLTATYRGPNDAEKNGELSPSPFRSYHQELVDSVTHLFGKNGSYSPQEIIDGTSAVPLMLQVFLGQFLSFEPLKKRPKSSDSGAKKKRNSVNTTLQPFRIFWYLAGTLISRIAGDFSTDLKDKELTAMLKSVYESLQLLLKSNVPVPSTEDKDLYKLLQTIVITVLQLKTDHPPALAQCMKILELLVRLDHMLTHDHLKSIIVFIARSQQESECDLLEISVQLLSTFLNCYEKLRQLDGFFEFFLSALPTLNTCQDQLGILMSHPTTIAGLSKAVRNSPSGQVFSLMKQFKQWIFDNTGSLQASAFSTEHQKMDTMFLIQASVFSTILRNIQVSPAIARDMGLLCDDISHGPVLKLTEDYDESRLSGRLHRMKSSLLIYGWLIDLRMRCQFWNDLGELCLPSRIESILHHGIRTFTDESGQIWNGEDDSCDKGILHVLDELHFLAGFLLKQLDCTIHGQQKSAGLPNHSSVRHELSQNITKAQELANFILTVANERNLWTMIAPMISFWTPYAKPRHLDAFLIWLLSSAASTSPATTDQKIATALLRDDSFYDNAYLSCRLGSIGLNLVYSRIINSHFRGGHALNTPFSLPAVALTSDDLSLLIENDSGLMSSWSQKDQLDVPEEQIRVLMVINGLPGKIWARDGLVAGLHSGLSIDAFCRLAIRQSTDLVSCAGFIHLLATVRISIARLLDKVTNWNDVLEINSARLSRALIKSTFASSLDGLRFLHDERFSYLLSSAALMITSLCRLGNVYSAVLAGLLDGFEEVLTQTHSGDSILVVGSFIRPLLRWRCNYAIASNSNALKERSDLVIDSAAQRLCPIICRNCIEDSLGSSRQREADILLLADFIRYANEQNCKMERFSKYGINESLVNAVQNRLLDSAEGPDLAPNPVSYFIISISGTKLYHQDQWKKILEAVLSGVREDRTSVKNMFCSLLRNSSIEELREMTEILLKETSKPKQEIPVMQLFCLVVSNHDENLHSYDVLSHVAPQILSRSLDLLASKESETKYTLDIATTLILGLISNKDIIHVTPRNIAFILASIATALGPASCQSPKCAGTHAYNACFSIVSFLLQRFSKQLCICAPLAIGTVSTMLAHALSTSLSESEVINRAQKMGRLCELLSPHKDVYKKHILGMILAFVRSIEDGMSYVHKTNLTPVLYTLLDMLSQYEMKQLNSLLSPSGRTLFRSLNESYQRLYTYKGT